MLAAFLASGLALTSPHRIVGRPLRVLEAASVDVSGGAFERRIRLYGPRDLERVARAVEDAPPHRRGTLRLQGPRGPPGAAGRGARRPDPGQRSARTRSWSSSPTSPRTICRNPCARSRPSASSWRNGTATNWTTGPSSTSTSPSTAPNACRSSSTTCSTFSRVGRVGEVVLVALDDVLDRAVGNQRGAGGDGRACRTGRAAAHRDGRRHHPDHALQHLIANAVSSRCPTGRPRSPSAARRSRTDSGG